MALSPQQLAFFEDNGVVTVDSPFTSSQLDAAERALDRLAGPLEPPAYRSSVAAYQDSGAPSPLTEPAIVELFAHPYVERCAASILRADAVRFFQAAVSTPGCPATPAGGLPRLTSPRAHRPWWCTRSPRRSNSGASRPPLTPGCVSPL